MKKIFSIFFLVLSVICVIISVSKFLEQKNAGKEYEELRILAKKDVTETEEPDTEMPEETVEPESAEDDVTEESEAVEEAETNIMDADVVTGPEAVNEPETEAVDSTETEDTGMIDTIEAEETADLSDADEEVSESLDTEETEKSEAVDAETVIESEVLDSAEAGKDAKLPKVTVTPTPVPTPKEEPSRVIVTYEDSLEIPIDFEALSEVNPDIYAWIEVEGTKVDYPIVQDKEDDTFYVDHSFERKSAVEGAIFTESYNHKDFEDPNTVIYGHNMKNGSMFQTLHSFSDRAFFNENRDVTVYMPDQIRHYEIFAAYVYDSRHILQTYDFSDEYIFRYYLNEITSMRDMNSFVDNSYGLKKNDKILTLSTCYRGIAEKRFLVQAVLVSIENKK